MTKKERFSMKIDRISRQEVDLLECLIRIDIHRALDPRADEMLERLIEAGLVNSSVGELTLTLAGIERCKSLQHRITGDKEAAKVLAGRGILLASSSDNKAGRGKA